MVAKSLLRTVSRYECDTFNYEDSVLYYYTFMRDKNSNLPDESLRVKELRSLLRARKMALLKAVTMAENIKLELVVVQREYEERIEPLAIEVTLLDEKVFELKKVKDLMDKGLSLLEAKRLVKERDTSREERERARVAEEERDYVEGAKPVKGKMSGDGQSRHSAEIKKLWRTLACRFHPDLTQDESEKRIREEMMKKINEAYVKKDIDALRELALGFECKEIETICNNEEGLEEELALTEESLNRVLQRITAFRRSNWQFISREKRKAKRENRDYFSEMENSHLVEIAARKRLILRIERELSVDVATV